MNTKNIKSFWLCIMMMALLFFQASASQLITKLVIISETVSNYIQAYAKEHDGKVPTNWSELKPYVDLDRVAMTIGVTLDSQMLLVGGNHPKLPGSGDLELVAVTTFPINEDRRQTIGRYIVYRRPDGRFFSRWENEDVIQAALAKVNTQVPSAAIFNEIPLKASSIEYAMKLVEDAVKQGIPPEKAAELVIKHVQDVTDRKATYVSTWADVVAQQTVAPQKKDQKPEQAHSLIGETYSQNWMVWLLAILLALAGLYGLLRKSNK